MANYLKLSFSLILLLGTGSSCKSRNSNIPSKESIELNNAGVKCLMDYPINGEKGLDSAINFLKEAIQCDSTYLIAYMSLATTYDHKKNYAQEMINIDKALILTNNDPMILTCKGMLFERMGHIDSANKSYHLAKTGYDKRMTAHPSSGIIDGIVYLKALMYGKDAAIEELDEQIKKHPELSSNLSYEYEIYKYFDRNNEVFEMPTERSLN